ncbi:hypothetical protein hmeg3_04245 [Herbaspirillum sp. meg3]|uniref:hypothetical protein n=1 Tax=Herbaspirillum sp. meg3 TaxID=2025949 RepID=UPI000B982C36|nr:hypothetical protein [Herbaspirillum sp. meg3]ASU37580.1 hypothetical protein hmeg3_04245 [Herbaspirillum sp. meg3]
MRIIRILALSVLVTTSFKLEAHTIKPVFEIQSETYRETYQEKFEGSYLMSEQATMYGIGATMGIWIDNRHGLFLIGRYAQGKSDYKNSHEDRENGQNRYLYEIRAVYECAFPILNTEVTPSIGLGYRTLTDRLDQITNDEKIGYRRESRYTFLSAGIKAKYTSPSARFSITPQIAYQYLLKGTQYSSYDAQFNIPTLIHQQRNGRGLEASLTLAYPLANRSEIRIAPFYRYWRIANSEACAECSLEPANTTKEIGARFTYAF